MSDHYILQDGVPIAVDFMTWARWLNAADCRGVYHIDHRVPIDRGGTDDDGNLCLTCTNCNLKKRNMMPYEFNGRLL